MEHGRLKEWRLLRFHSLRFHSNKTRVFRFLPLPSHRRLHGLKLGAAFTVVRMGSLHRLHQR